MTRFHKQLLVPGEQITLANEAMAGRLTPQLDEDGYYARFTQEYDNNFAIEVGVREGEPGNPRLTLVTLWDNNDQQVASEVVTGEVDQDYILINNTDTYSLSIVRAANSTLTTDAAAQYNRDPTHCPACGSATIHRGPLQVDTTGIWARVECCACDARWRNIYMFQSISMLPDDWDPPAGKTKNRMRCSAR